MRAAIGKCVCVCARARVCVSVMQAYTHTHTHTHTHTQIQTLLSLRQLHDAGLELLVVGAAVAVNVLRIRSDHSVETVKVVTGKEPW